MQTFTIHPPLAASSSLRETKAHVKERYLRVRRLVFLARLQALALLWVVDSEGTSQRVQVSGAFDDLSSDTQGEIIARLAAAGLEEGPAPTSWEAHLALSARLERTISEALRIGTRAEAMIQRRAERLHACRAPHSVPAQLRSGEAERLMAASGPIPLAGPRSVHAVDELWAAVHATAPWMEPASARLYRAMRGAVAEGRGPFMPPVLLWGAPGIGKTTLPRRLGALMNTPIIEIDAGLSSAAFRVAGADRTWASSHPGDPIEAILRHRVANPIIVVNEIDRVGGGSLKSGGTRSSLTDALLTLLDRGSAAGFRCPYFGLGFDMSAITWVLTANTLDAVDPALLSRVIRVEIPRPAPVHVAQIVRQGLGDLDSGIASEAARLVAARWDSDPRMTLRQVAALVARLRDGASAPRLH